MTKVLRSYEAQHEQRWLPQPIPEAIAVQDIDPLEVAAEIRSRAEAEAEAILAQAQRDAERICQQAYEEGVAAGHAEGIQVSEHVYDEKIAELHTLVEEINEERDTAFVRVEEELVRLSVAIAEKVIGQQVTLSPEVIVGLARSNMKRIREREVLRLRVNPEDIAMLTEHRHALLADVDGVKEIHLYDDRRIARGGMVIEADSGSLDARLHSQLDLITRALDEALEVPHEPTSD